MKSYSKKFGEKMSAHMVNEQLPLSEIPETLEEKVSEYGVSNIDNSTNDNNPSITSPDKLDEMKSVSVTNEKILTNEMKETINKLLLESLFGLDYKSKNVSKTTQSSEQNKTGISKQKLEELENEEEMALQLAIQDSCIANCQNDENIEDEIQLSLNVPDNVPDNEVVSGNEVVNNEVVSGDEVVNNEVVSGDEIVNNESTEIFDFDDNNHIFNNIPSYTWHEGRRGKFSDDNSDSYTRRSKRVAISSVYDPKTIYNFMMEMLQKAWEIELTTTDPEAEYSYYVFSPYYRDRQDEFSKKSLQKKIGIKTKLDIVHANFILYIYYLLYSEFAKTSDETIFEESYITGILCSDSNFELAKFLEAVALKKAHQLDGISSLIHSMLSLNLQSSNLDVQYQVWLMTYNRQSKKLITPSSDQDVKEFLSIEEICYKYSPGWFSDKFDPKPTLKEKAIEAVSTVGEAIDSVIQQIDSTITSGVRKSDSIIDKIIESKTEKLTETRNPIVTDEVLAPDFEETTPLLNQEDDEAFNQMVKNISNETIDDHLIELMDISTFDISKGGLRRRKVEHVEKTVNESEPLLSCPSTPRSQKTKKSEETNTITSSITSILNFFNGR